MHTHTLAATKRPPLTPPLALRQSAAHHTDKSASALLSREEWRRIVMDMIG